MCGGFTVSLSACAETAPPSYQDFPGKASSFGSSDRRRRGGGHEGPDLLAVDLLLLQEEAGAPDQDVLFLPEDRQRPVVLAADALPDLRSMISEVASL